MEVDRFLRAVSFVLLSSLQLDQQYNEFKLRSIMSEHKKTITAISWCPDNPDLFASASADNLLIVWNVAEKKAVARLDNTKGSWMIHAGLFQHRSVKPHSLFLFLRRPCVSQLVLELGRRSGVRLPARSAVHLGLPRSRSWGHGA